MASNKYQLQTTHWAKDFITTTMLLEAVIGKLRNLGFSDIDIFEWDSQNTQKGSRGGRTFTRMCRWELLPVVDGPNVDSTTV
ncbi:hypothetical protein [Pasteuria penetrans]|uniref:hypothetical protein n=1 Tax=Pasteuria penetrans TaxID=86005 RepID=UPI0011EEFB93|nr:hypothetical protein [Pasteuria penetrans]